MAEFDPFPREPKTFLKFYPKTKGDLTKHCDSLRRLTADSDAACGLTSDELRLMGRDIQRAIDMLDLAEVVMRDLRCEYARSGDAP